MSTLKKVFIQIGVIFIGIISGIVGVLLFKNFSSKKEETHEGSKEIKIIKNEGKTEILPQSEELDETLDDIEKDILN